jgi:RNA polymerase sigma factor (sigma-70 family)
MSCAAAALVSDMGRSDAELLEASRRGERDAFGALIERYQGVVSAVSYSRTGDHALGEDVAQETFIAAWRQLGQLREPGRLRSWLCGIARNLARKARRRSAREVPLEHTLVFEGANRFDHAAEAESGRVVRDALLRVPETYRDVLVLILPRSALAPPWPRSRIADPVVGPPGACLPRMRGPRAERV